MSAIKQLTNSPKEPPQLWIPGQRHELHGHYPTPDTDELQAYWKEYAPNSHPEPAPGIYGVIDTLSIDESIGVTGFASIDLCEVLRHTADAVMKIKGLSVQDMDLVHSYGPSIGIEQDDVVATVQVLMNADSVKPVADDLEIKKILQSWRKVGVYCVANTSTLPGCEVPTLKFLRRHYSECFDGLLLPRNHDGQGPVSKGQAAKMTIEEIVGLKSLTAIHIDDAPHHNKGFIDAFADDPQVTVYAFMPGFKGNEVEVEGTVRTQDSLEAFELANDLFRKARNEQQ